MLDRTHSTQVNATAKSLRNLVPPALRTPVALYLSRYAIDTMRAY